MSKHLANFPEGLRSGKINNATAILQGHVLTRDPTDNELVVRCAVDHSPSVAGIAMYDGGAQNTEIGYATGGDVLVRNTSGGAIAAEVLLVADDAGGVRAAAATETNWVGTSNEASADGDLFSARLHPMKAILA